ncbi:MAG TPA: hypothetical protein ENJ84_02720, partial [Gammaproteobacteria bacterium]|nr:hypothetical protein [Gammaproteobacteria bacterium]
MASYQPKGFFSSVLVIALLSLIAVDTLAAERALVVVVARDMPASNFDRHFNQRKLRRIYRKQRLLWRNGKRIAPLNLMASSPLREVFNQSVFHRSLDQMAAFWNERYFEGISPPHVVDSQEAVLRFVSRIPGAIGY